MRNFQLSRQYWAYLAKQLGLMNLVWKSISSQDGEDGIVTVCYI